MPRSDLSKVDASRRAASELEYILRDNKKNPAEPTISVDEAKKEGRVYQANTT